MADPTDAVDLPELLAGLEAALTSAADPDWAPAMRAYMKDRFEFLGLGTPERRALSRPFLAVARRLPQSDVLDLADALWARQEREHQYVGADLLRATARRFDASALPRLRQLVVTRSWWDTVDTLAKAVGDLVRAHPELEADMDRWVLDHDLWVVRVALLHQLGAGAAADGDRLFRYCALHTEDPRFFIRKAVGWALRDHARTDPDGVRAFVAAHPELSGLSRREALKHL